MTEEERRRWRQWYWLFLLVSPPMAMLAIPMSRTLRSWVPTAWQPLVSFGAPIMVFLLPVVCDGEFLPFIIEAGEHPHVAFAQLIVF